MLIRAVNSVLNQTFPVHEILICDDGSSDESESKIAALDNSKVKWINCGNNGRPSIPRNIGIKKSTGNWIAFLDNDDEWLPEKLMKQIETLKATNSLFICSNAYKITKEKVIGTYLEYNNNKLNFADMLCVNNVICSSVLVQKELLILNSLFPEEPEFKSIEDYGLWLRLAGITDFVYIKEPLLNYYCNTDLSISNTYSDIWKVKEVVFCGFKRWCKTNHVIISKEKRKLFRIAFKVMKRKGEPTKLIILVKKIINKLIKN